MIRQILLITDGHSNVGVNPVVAAAQAQAENIVVNVIGIVNPKTSGSLSRSNHDDAYGNHYTGETGMHGKASGFTDRGIQEIEEIARAGGGVSRVVTASKLAQTMQMMTRKTVTHTIHQVVNQELRQLLGTPSLETLPPDKRGEVVQLVEDLSEKTYIQVALLIDTSESMKPMLPTVREAIADLLLSLQSRSGQSEMAVFHFPGTVFGQQGAELDIGWTKDLKQVNHLFQRLRMKGTTPTGPALMDVIRYMVEQPKMEVLNDSDRILIEEPKRAARAVNDEDQGLLGDYVV